MKKKRKYCCCKQRTKILKFDIWEYINIDDINRLLDSKIKGFSTEIDYSFKKINKNGKVILEAKYYQDG